MLAEQAVPHLPLVDALRHADGVELRRPLGLRHDELQAEGFQAAQ